jgi:deoxycytidylate deaminase
VKNGNVLAVGVNRDKNHPSIMSEGHIKPGACVHAEVDALRRVANPRGSVVYVARVDRSGMPAYSRPCPNCEQTLSSAGVKRVFHT